MYIGITYYDNLNDEGIKYLFNKGYAIATIINSEHHTSRFYWGDSILHVFEIMLDQNSFKIFCQWANKYGYGYTVIRNVRSYLRGCIEEGNSGMVIYRPDMVDLS